MNFDPSYDVVSSIARQRQERLEQHAAEVRQRRQIRQLRAISWYGRTQNTSPPTDAA